MTLMPATTSSPAAYPATTTATAAAASRGARGARGARGDNALREAIRTLALRRGKVILASGRESDFIFDLKPVAMNPKWAQEVGATLWRLITREGEAPRWIGGLAAGAVPLVCAVTAWGHAQGVAVGGFFVRKEAKAHGTRQQLEGLPPTYSGCFPSEEEVVMVDDVTTTGGSLLTSVKAAQAQGATIRRVITLVDRDEGAQELFEKNGLTLSAAFTRYDFV